MDGVTVVNPLLEKVMKETALDKVRQKFILKSAENPDIMEAVDELYKSISKLIGEEKLFFYDAAAPIIEKDRCTYRY